MRKMRWTLLPAFFLGLALSAPACSDDDSGSGVDVNKICSDVCTKQTSCGSDQDQATCEADCRAMVPKVVDGFISASADCIASHTCEELDNDVCDGVGQEFCTTDIRPLFETICTQGVNCQGGTQSDIDECVNHNVSDPDNAMLKCFTKSALDDYGNCLKKLDCNATEEQYQACMESELGIRFHDDAQPGN